MAFFWNFWPLKCEDLLSGVWYHQVVQQKLFNHLKMSFSFCSQVIFITFVTFDIKESSGHDVIYVTNTLHLVVRKNLISNIFESKPFSSMFWVLYLLDRKYFKLTKFIQKIDPNSRMLRIFMDSVDKSALYI